MGKFGRVLLRLRCGQIDLVQNRNDREVVFEGEVEIRQRLRLDALGRVDEQHRSFACGKGTRHLIGEIHVTWGVDQIQDVGVAVGCLIRQAHRLGLDRDAPLTLDVHPVEVLGTHLSLLDHAGGLQHAVGQRGLAVVDVRDDAEVADHRGISGAGGWGGQADSFGGDLP